MLCTMALAAEKSDFRPFEPKQDLLSLHYDHAPDKDDGHSAAADRTLLDARFDADWIRQHTVAVSGAYGKNAKRFNDKSDAVMDTVWNDRGGWLDAHADHGAAVQQLAKRWRQILDAGGDIWVKEGGQSDITAEVIKRLQAKNLGFEPRRRVHVVQHSDWNENQSGDDALKFCKQNTDYQRIPDANAYLNEKGGNAKFERAALAHPTQRDGWRAAFAYYPTSVRLDFSDTGELLHILGLGRVGIDEFGERYLAPSKQE